MDIRNIPTYVINLDKNPERLKYVQENFAKLQIDIERFPGIYAKGLDKSYLEKVVHPFVWYTIREGATVDPEIDSLGAIGCSLSHIKLWKQLLESNKDVYHILEDDATPVASIKEINKFVNDVVQLDSEWDVIYLGYLHPGPSLYDTRHIKLANNINKINAISFGTQSYLINKKGAEKLLRYALPIIHHIDSYMSYMAICNGLHSYRPKTSLIKQPFIGPFSSEVLSNNINFKVFINRMPASFIILCILCSILFFIAMVIKAVNRRSS